MGDLKNSTDKIYVFYGVFNALFKGLARFDFISQQNI
jgi:hypothetical protein